MRSERSTIVRWRDVRSLVKLAFGQNMKAFVRRVRASDERDNSRMRASCPLPKEVPFIRLQIYPQKKNIFQWEKVMLFWSGCLRMRERNSETREKWKSPETWSRWTVRRRPHEVLISVSRNTWHYLVREKENTSMTLIDKDFPRQQMSTFSMLR